MGLSRDVADIDMRSISDAAAEKAERGRSPEAVEPGTYQVVLEEAAVAQMIEFLAFESFNGLFHEEGRSFTSSSMGEAVMGDNISIWDDGMDRTGIPSPFDGEGVARERVDFIKNGVLKAVVYDHQTAAKYGRQDTGHAWTAPNPYGPVASNLFMAPGEVKSVDELVRSVDRGILVTTFHYTNLVEPMRVVLTGMTRHGTFLIENGKVTKPLKNLRFTQSVLDAFSEVEALTSETKLLGDYLRVAAPAALIREFRFTGVSDS
jgi:predicted Zn-dependent protease